MAPTTRAGVCSRRRFLQLASLTAAAGALPQLAFAGEEDAAAGEAAASTPLSVGYVVGSEDLADVARPDWWPAWRSASAVRAAGSSAAAATADPLEVMPAAELPGDPFLAVVPVRVAVLGLYPEFDDVPDATFDLVLTARFVTGDPFAPELPFYAWGWRDDPAPSSGSPIRFTVPVERESGLRLALDARQVKRQAARFAVPGDGGLRVRAGSARATGAASAGRRSAWRQEAALSVGIEAAAPKLQRGVYLLGLEPRLWDRRGELPAGALPSELAPSLVIGVEAAEVEE